MVDKLPEELSTQKQNKVTRYTDIVEPVYVFIETQPMPYLKGDSSLSKRPFQKLGRVRFGSGSRLNGGRGLGEG